MLFLSRGAVAGTHDAALSVAAGPDTDAALGSALEGTTACGEGKLGLDALRRIEGNERGAVTEILDRIVNANGIRELAGIHAVVRIPEQFEFAEGMDEFGAEHFGQKRGAGLAVSVFAGKRAAKGNDDIGSAFDELAETV